MTQWEGKERRTLNMPYCNQHLDFVKQIAELTILLKGVATQMVDSTNFRKSVILSLMGIVFTVFLHVGTTCYFVGQLSQQVTINTARLNVIEQTARELIKTGVLK